MQLISRAFLSIALFCAAALAQQATREVEIRPPSGYTPLQLQTSNELQKVLDTSVAEILAAGTVKPNELSATVIDLADPKGPRWASSRGEDQTYPASVVKMFFMAALHQQLQDGKVTLTKELERGLRDMIVDSSNEATQYILDVLTDTASGAELPQAEFDRWQHKRNRVNRYFSAMGYSNINVNQKTFCEDAYGIEQQSRNYKGQNRNMLTTNATARLLAEIVLGRSVNPDRSRQMMELMKRDPFKETKDTDNQGTGFSGKALIDRKETGARLWSKAGWTSRSRHDAAYIEMPDGRRLVVVVFTDNHANEREIIPSLVSKILDRTARSTAAGRK